MNGRLLPRLSSTAKERATLAWRAAVTQAEHARQWLKPRRRMVCWTAGISIAVVVLIGFSSSGGVAWLWTKYSTHHAAISPLLTLSAGVAVAGVALLRHFAQTEADRQRRITESFSKAIEQLGSNKVEVRLGGIYSLERLSRESPNDYWTVMENLTAFVRERSQRAEVGRAERVTQRAYFLWLEAGRPEGNADFFWAKAEFEQTPTDIGGVLTVLARRSERGRKRETANDWHLDLAGAILRRASFMQPHFEGAILFGAHLQGANLFGAHLEGAILYGAHLERAILFMAHLERAHLFEAHLEGAMLGRAHLEGANLQCAHLEGANLEGAHLQGANLEGAHLQGANLEGAHLQGAILDGVHLAEAFGDASTQLPEGVIRPALWALVGKRALQNS